MAKLNEKQSKALTKLKKFDPKLEIFWDKNMKIPRFMRGKLSSPSSKNPEVIARKYLEENRDLVDMQEGLVEYLELADVVSDIHGAHHVLFRQFLSELPVFEGSLQVHINPEGVVFACKDYRLAELRLSLEPEVTVISAIETVLEDLGPKKKLRLPGAWQMIYRDREKRPHLTWQIETLSAEGLAGSFYFVDARTGKVLYSFSQIRDALSRRTYTAHNETEVPGELILEDEETVPDEVALAAHEHMAVVYRYFKDRFGRDSYDDRGAALVSTVHFGRNYNNAFWSDYYKQLVFGDGDGYRWKPLAFALDLVAHEMTHALCSLTARFVYTEEAGALDESFADVFAVFISNRETITDWQMGEGVYTPYHEGDALRDLSSPEKYGQPDHADNCHYLVPGERSDPYKNDRGYVHYNSGIPNKVAYLIIEGGTHYGISVEGIGREKAEQIYFLALTAYLASSTLSRWTFRQARYALLNACWQLYGRKGPEYATIKDAWAAVGIGEPKADLHLIEKELFPKAYVPDNCPEGIQSSIYIPEEGLVEDIRVSVTIMHPYLRDLRVTLFSPIGESVVLHDRQKDSKKNLVRTYNLGSVPGLRAYLGDRVQGKWTLRVSDHAREHSGYLVRWELKFLARKAEKKELKRELFPFKEIPDNDPAGIESRIEIEKSGKIVNLDVSLDISHSRIGDLRVSLLMPSGEELVLHNRTGYGRRDLRKVYSTRSGDEMQAAVSKDINGIWILKVEDLAKRDVGTLDSWGLCIIYE